MTIEVIPCEQGSQEWFDARAGAITASMFSEVMDKLKSGKNKGGWKKAAEDYAFRLAIERIHGSALSDAAQFETHAMRRGSELEPEARATHALVYDLDIARAGFVITKDGKFGASADGLIGDDGGSEYKCLIDPARIRSIIIDEEIDEFMPQVQGCLWLTGRKWWHFVLYCPSLTDINKDLTVFHVVRDEEYINELEQELIKFDKLVEFYRSKLLE